MQQRILLSGASGLIGSELLLFLRALGHEVVRLVRTSKDLPPDAIYWDPLEGNFSKDPFEGFDAVIHLAGASITQKRWTKERKQELFLSRCRDTWLLSQVLARLYRPPKTLICASAVGYYGDRGTERLNEDSPPGSGFLAELCRKWESSTHAIAGRGARVVHTRFGLVLSPKGGILGQLLPLFRLGLGGKLGSGDQILSWIAVEDVVRAIAHVLQTKNLEGAVNFTAPHSISQIEFAKTLAKHLHRPACLTLPKWLLKGIFGQMGKELLLSSCDAAPEKLLRSGFKFEYEFLEAVFDRV